MPLPSRETVLARVATADFPSGTLPDYGIYRAQVVDQAGNLPAIPGGFVLSHQLGPEGSRQRRALDDAWHGLRGSPGAWMADALAPRKFMPVLGPAASWKDSPSMMARVGSDALIRACPIEPDYVSDRLLGLIGMDPRDEEMSADELREYKRQRRVADGIKLLIRSAWQPVDGDGGLLVAGYPSEQLRAEYPGVSIPGAAFGSILAFRDFNHATHGQRAVLMIFRSARGFIRKTYHEMNSYRSEVPQLENALMATHEVLCRIETKWRRGVSVDDKRELMESLDAVTAQGLRVLERCYSPEKAQARQLFLEARGLLDPHGVQNASAALSKLVAVRTRFELRLSDIGDQQVFSAEDLRAIQIYVVQAEKWFDDLRERLLRDPIETLRRLKNPHLHCLEIRPFRPMAYALFWIARKLRDPTFDPTRGAGTAAERESRLVNQAWTVLRLHRMGRQTDEVSMLLTFRPPASPLHFKNALESPDEPIHLLDGGMYSSGGHRILGLQLEALRGFVAKECADYSDPKTQLWSYARLHRFRDDVDAIVHGKKIRADGFTDSSYGVGPTKYGELASERAEASARELAHRDGPAMLAG